MKISAASLILCAAAPAALAQWTYTAPHLLNPYIAGYWMTPFNGSITAGTLSVTSPPTSAGSMIYNSSVGTEYEVRTVLALTGNGGRYDTYLRATSNALYSQSTTAGTAYVVELQNPTFTGPSCSGGTLQGGFRTSRTCAQPTPAPTTSTTTT
jgi:hypothetical protein